MLDTTMVRRESEAATFPKASPGYAVPLGHLLADKLLPGSTSPSKTSTTKQTGTPTAQDETTDSD